MYLLSSFKLALWFMCLDSLFCQRPPNPTTKYVSGIKLFEYGIYQAKPIISSYFLKLLGQNVFYMTYSASAQAKLL